jgi:hypothetical protein
MDKQHLSFEISFNDVGAFIDHWASRYGDDKGRDEAFYDPYIGKDKRDMDVLTPLFMWKNGGVIAARKLEGIRKNYFDDWTDDNGLEARYLDPRKDNGPIWNIFYLHCRQPNRYPIFDQHAHRAMVYIQTGTICEDLTSDHELVYKSYDNYRCFVKGVQQDGKHELRTIERALYTFGRFLKRVKPFAESGLLITPAL